MLARSLLQIRAVTAGLFGLVVTACASVPPPAPPPEPPLPEVRLNIKAFPVLIIEYPDLVVAVFCGEHDAVTVKRADGRMLWLLWAKCRGA